MAFEQTKTSLPIELDNRREGGNCPIANRRPCSNWEGVRSNGHKKEIICFISRDFQRVLLRRTRRDQVNVYPHGEDQSDEIDILCVPVLNRILQSS